MIKIYETENEKYHGDITDEQLQFLIDQLEEEFAEDQDYYITLDTMEFLKSKGMSPALENFLKKAMGNREEMEIRWSKE